MKIVSADFIKSAEKPDQFPHFGVPEFAFFGRSNAGKSSLINMIINRKNLVKTGSRPGMTQTVNFFLINKKGSEKRPFSLVDLPGYGYAQTKKSTVKKIDSMLYAYCRNRRELRTMFFLMDIRRPPSSVEKDILDFFLQESIPYCIVATKADKVGKNEQNKVRSAWADFFLCDREQIIISSSLKKSGRDHIHAVISTGCIQ